uniref:Uncharacterized protein LOC105125917 isoform X2 n=1 Tax=Rhizophora mucronata TaxID=61149 RepID=A0A2P2MMC4_RHIMU
MGYSSFLIKSPKKEEQEVPETVDHQFSNGAREANDARKEMDIIDELESILGIDSNKGEENLSKYSMSGQHGWDFMDWEENHPNGGCEELGDCCQFDEYRSKNFFAGEEEEREYNIKVITTESVGVWDVNEKNNNVSLNLNLNYQDVLDAWSDRGPLWVDNCTLSMATNGCFVSIRLPYHHINSFAFISLSIYFSAISIRLVVVCGIIILKKGYIYMIHNLTISIDIFLLLNHGK